MGGLFMVKRKMAKKMVSTLSLIGVLSVFLVGCDLRPKQWKAAGRIEDFQSITTVKETEEMQALFRLLQVSPNQVTVSGNKTSEKKRGENTTVSYEIEVEGQEEKSGYYCMTMCKKADVQGKYIKIAKALSEKEASLVKRNGEPKGKLCKVLYRGLVEDMDAVPEEKKEIPIDASRCKEYYATTESILLWQRNSFEEKVRKKYKIIIEEDWCKIKNRKNGKTMCEIDLAAIRQDYMKKRESAEYVDYQDTGKEIGFHTVSGEWQWEKEKQEADIHVMVSEKGLYFSYYSGVYRYNFSKRKFVKKLDGEKYPQWMSQFAHLKMNAEGEMCIMKECQRKNKAATRILTIRAMDSL